MNELISRAWSDDGWAGYDHRHVGATIVDGAFGVAVPEGCLHDWSGSAVIADDDNVGLCGIN